MPNDTSRGAPPPHRIESILAEIHPDFIESGAKTITQEDVARLVEHADEVLRAFSKGGVLRRFAPRVGPMVALVRDYWSAEYRDVPYWTVAVITFTLGYVLKPIDIIPNVLPVIGQLDDAVVVGHGLDMVRKELEAYEEWKLAARDGR
jgi:uncharacterized membrane protein YkvA (DUF1232 family)